jgi:hypothetical protein
MLATIVLASVTSFVNVAPINVASCRILRPVRVSEANDSWIDTIRRYALHVRFSDIASEPISKVIFRLDDGTTVGDVGTFSPGVSIDHILPLKDMNAKSCAVDSVPLADGTQVSVVRQ